MKPLVSEMWCIGAWWTVTGDSCLPILRAPLNVLTVLCCVGLKVSGGVMLMRSWSPSDSGPDWSLYTTTYIPRITL